MAKSKTKCALNTSAIADQILNFACSMIKARRTDGKPDTLPAGWLERQLLIDGRVGYLHSNTDAGGFFRIRGNGQRNRYGLPVEVVAQTQASGSAAFTVPVYDPERDDNTGRMAIIRANSGSVSPYLSILRYAEMIARAELHVNTNLLASMRTQILGVPKSRTVMGEIILSDAMAGEPTILEQDALASIDTLDVSVPLTAPAVHALTLQLWSDAIKQFGGITPGAYKAERTQTAEVNANIAESIDNVYILLDQANQDMERQEVPYRLEYNGFGKNYESEQEQDESKETEVENNGSEQA